MKHKWKEKHTTFQNKKSFRKNIVVIEEERFYYINSTDSYIFSPALIKCENFRFN